MGEHRRGHYVLFPGEMRALAQLGIELGTHGRSYDLRRAREREIGLTVRPTFPSSIGMVTGVGVICLHVCLFGGRQGAAWTVRD